MVEINEFLSKIIEKIKWGDIKFDRKKGKNFYFRNQEYEICYNIYLESISIFEIKDNNDSLEWLFYIDKHNFLLGKTKIDEYIFNSLFEVIVQSCIQSEDIDALNYEISEYVEKEEYEKANKIKKILEFIEPWLDTY